MVILSSKELFSAFLFIANVSHAHSIHTCTTDAGVVSCVTRQIPTTKITHTDNYEAVHLHKRIFLRAKIKLMHPTLHIIFNMHYKMSSKKLFSVLLWCHWLFFSSFSNSYFVLVMQKLETFSLLSAILWRKTWELATSLAYDWIFMLIFLHASTSLFLYIVFITLLIVFIN